MQGGENLKSIAKSVWGDSNLWYLIANANNLEVDSPLTAGQTLKLPARVNVVHNDADTFTPYNPSEAIGNTTPTLPMPANSAGGCGGAGAILVVVVAIVVTVLTEGATSDFLVESLAWAQGAADVAGAVVGAAAGSIASQGVAIAIGQQESFSWSAVAMSALSAGVTQGVGGPVDGGWVDKAKNAALANGTNQGVAVLTGMQDRFDWRSVVASAVSAGVGEAVGSSETLKKLGVDMHRGLTVAASRTAATLAVGGKINVENIAVDAFGNALGHGLADALTAPSLPESLRALPQEQQDRILALAKVAGMNVWSSEDKYRILKDATDLRYSADAQDLSSAEVWRRTSNALGLMGADQQQLDELQTAYTNAGLLRTGQVDMKLLGELTVSNDALVEDLAGPDTRQAAFLGARSIDTGVIGVGKVLDQFGRYVDSRPLAKLALEGLDLVSGPIMYAVRQTDVVKNLTNALTAEVQGVFGNGFAEAGRSESDSAQGAIGGTAILFAGVSGFAGLVTGFLKFAPSASGFVNPRKQIGAVGDNVTSPNSTMRKNANASGSYVDPRTNEIKAATGTLAADHIVPQKWIKEQPGFEKLTNEQKSFILNHPDNTQGLPGPLNSSKRATMPGEWDRFRGEPLHPDYVANDAVRAKVIQARIRDMIDGFNKE